MKLAWLKSSKRPSRVPEHARLPLALGLAMVMAVCLTTLSVAIYTLSGASKLDLSRPGFEQEREEVRQTESTKIYDTTSPITKQTIDEFLQEYDSRTKDLNEYGDFQDPALNDTYLQLTK